MQLLLVNNKSDRKNIYHGKFSPFSIFHFPRNREIRKVGSLEPNTYPEGQMWQKQNTQFHKKKNRESETKLKSYRDSSSYRIKHLFSLPLSLSQFRKWSQADYSHFLCKTLITDPPSLHFSSILSPSLSLKEPNFRSLTLQSSIPFRQSIHCNHFPNAQEQGLSFLYFLPPEFLNWRHSIYGGRIRRPIVRVLGLLGSVKAGGYWGQVNGGSARYPPRSCLCFLSIG